MLSKPFVVCALAAMLAPGRMALAQDWLAAAEESLRAELNRRYPLVSEWTLVGLATEKQRASLYGSRPKQVETLQVGPRSAVRLEWLNRADRREATIVWFAVEGMQMSAVASVDLRAGVVVDEASLEERRVDVLSLGCEPLNLPMGQSPMRIVRTVKAGQAICASWLVPKPPVMRGEVVTVRSVAGLVTVTASAVAQQDGHMGQVLRVRNPRSRESFAAVVTGNAEVTVQ